MRKLKYKSCDEYKQFQHDTPYIPQLLNGPSADSPPFNSSVTTSSLCGTTPPPRLETSDNSLYVTFVSANATSAAGFSFNFIRKSLSCNQNLQVGFIVLVVLFLIFT